jgi:hypothetical protein
VANTTRWLFTTGRATQCVGKKCRRHSWAQSAPVAVCRVEATTARCHGDLSREPTGGVGLRAVVVELSGGAIRAVAPRSVDCSEGNYYLRWYGRVPNSWEHELLRHGSHETAVAKHGVINSGVGLERGIVTSRSQGRMRSAAGEGVD